MVIKQNQTSRQTDFLQIERLTTKKVELSIYDTSSLEDDGNALDVSENVGANSKHEVKALLIQDDFLSLQDYARNNKSSPFTGFRLNSQAKT